MSFGEAFGLARGGAMPRADVALVSYGVNEPQRMTAGDVRAHLDAVQAMVRRRGGPDAVVWAGGPVDD